MLKSIATTALCVAVIAGTTAFAQSFATNATVTAKTDKGALSLRKEEKVALMFVEAMNSIEDTCDRHCTHFPNLDELVKRPPAKDGWGVGKLKYDPRTDPNYTYTMTISGDHWTIAASPKKPGFGGFYRGPNDSLTRYNPKGAADKSSEEITDLEIMGDSFVQQ